MAEGRWEEEWEEGESSGRTIEVSRRTFCAIVAELLLTGWVLGVFSLERRCAVRVLRLVGLDGVAACPR
jgi:hypothetical protein